MEKSLLFKDQYLEKEFKNSQTRKHQKSFTILCVTIVLQSTVLYFSNPLEIKIFEFPKILIFLCAAFAVFGYFFMSKKFPSHLDKGISLYIFLFIVCISEFIHTMQISNKLAPWVYFLLGVNIQTACLFLLICQIRWIHSILIISLSQVYSWFRVIDVLSTTGAQKTAFVTLVVQISLFSTLSYLIEKEQRNCFQKIRADSQQMSSFEEIMTTVLDSPIIIMKNDDVVFFNDATQKMFDIRTKGEIEFTLEGIQIINKESERFSQKPSKHNPIAKNLFIEDNKFCTLYQYYKSLERQNAVTDNKMDTRIQFLEGESLAITEEGNEIRSFSIHIGTINWKGSSSIILIIKDVSFVIQNFRSLDNYKNNLLATASHDLRTPLNGIMGMLESLLEQIIEPKHREILQISITSAKLLLSMVNDILDFSLISEGRLKLKFETTNIKELIEETVSIMAFQANLKGLTLEIENLLSEEEYYLVDGNRLRQVLLNLIGNAIKFTSLGHVKVRIYEEIIHNMVDIFKTNKKQNKDDEIKENSITEINFEKINSSPFDPRSIVLSSMNLDRKRLIFEVEDTGIGIKPEDIGKLFKLFSRVTSNHDNNMNGVGLGLAISQSLVVLMNSNRMGGIIKVTSEFGKGSRFRFPIYIDNEPSNQFKEIEELSMRLPRFKETKRLNLATLDDQNNKSNVDSEADILLEINKKMILVVDDDPINILVASNYLKSIASEYSFYTAENGKDAIDKVKTFALNNQFFDIFLMDCNMPEMDGYEASLKLKQMMRENSIPWAPIVAITANVASTDRDKCFQYGMDFYLTKPYTKIQLSKTLEKAIQVKRSL